MWGFSMLLSLITNPNLPTPGGHNPIDPKAIGSYVTLLHTCANDIEGVFTVGVLTLDTKRAQATMKCSHFSVGQIDMMIDHICTESVKDRANVYVAPAVFSPDLAPGKKGGEADIIAVLGAVADFDDADAIRWADRVPTDPNMVLETSPNRFQVFYFFERTLTVKEAKPFLAGLQQSCQCDPVSKDASHLWRVPGTFNWADKGKVAKGRGLEPVLVKTITSWVGGTVALESLPSISPRPDSLSRSGNAPNHTPASYEELWERLSNAVKRRIETPIKQGERSEKLYSAVLSLEEAGLSEDEAMSILEHHPKGPAGKHQKPENLRKDIARIYQGIEHEVAPLAAAKPNVFKLFSPEELEDLPPPSWLIEGLLTDDSFCVLFGESNIGKSFVALDFAMRVATGVNWGQRKVTRGDVVYINAEGLRGLPKRQAAWQMTYGQGAKSSIRFLPRAMDMTSASDRSQLLEEIKEKKMYPKLFVIDTLAKCFGDGDENTQQGMQAFLRGVENLRDAYPGSTVLVLHHTGKDKSRGERGSSSLRGAVDFAMSLECKNRGLILSCRKVRDEDKFKDIELELVPVQTRRGGTCIVREVGAASSQVGAMNTAKVGPALSPKTQAALDCLVAFGAAGANYQSWRDKSGLKDSTFKDARRHLNEAKLIKKGPDGNYHIAEGDDEAGETDRDGNA